MTRNLAVIIFFAVVFVVTSAAVTMAMPQGTPSVDFNRDVRPILSKNCFACHGPDEHDRKAGLRLDVREGTLEGALDVLSPGASEASELLARITDGDDPMPPAEHGPMLSDRDVDVLRRWIRDGAKYAKHWAFVPPVRPELSDEREPSSWSTRPIDRLVHARLRTVGLEPSEAANRYALIRRVSFDLIGLPPEWKHVDEFVPSPVPDAYEQVVDRLLASPAFGERWAAEWLDLARYADSSGYASDFPRVIWRYRDWVIDALNRNMPFDQFTVEQLAGDMLPNATRDQILATAFHRNTLTNSEGGTDDEEFRVAAVKDRADTTAQVWLGMTMGCAQCHSHKFDPISQTDYYRFYAYFNQTEDRDRQDDAPRLATPNREQAGAFDRLTAQVESLREQLRHPANHLDVERRRWEKRLPAVEKSWRVASEVEAVSESGATLTVDDVGVVVASGVSPSRDVYALTWDPRDGRLPTGIRLEVLSDPEHTSGGPGRAPGNGNVIVNEVRLRATPSAKAARSARYVRIELPGEERLLSLAEVEIESGGENIAKSGTARQSSVAYDGSPARAVDGVTSGVFTEASVTHTATETNPWWEVDLGALHVVDHVRVWNRTDGDLERRLRGYRVILLDDERNEVRRRRFRSAPEPSHDWNVAEDEVDVELIRPSATYTEADWDIALTIDGDFDPTKGWGLSPRLGLPQAAGFEVVGAGMRGIDRLRLEIVQNFGEHHVVGRFRLATSFAESPVRVLPHDVAEIVATPESERGADQRRRIAEHYASFAPRLTELRDEITRSERELAMLAVVETPVLRELPAKKQRTTYIMQKGNFLQRGDDVTAGIPGALAEAFGASGESTAVEEPAKEPKTRLELARWLVDRRNPLTARVTVNRFWARLFGRGLVATEEDFGSQGDVPTHPRLLDWLAVRFMDSGWDVKALLKTIVMSKTYRQSAKTLDIHRARDANHRYLSRFPRQRLTAEMVRDQALFAGGLLSRKMFGPSVYPPQPKGLWQAAFNGGDRRWPESHGEDRYRRALYTFLRRSASYPSLAAFDMPTREVCSLRRIPTNTPLQAFVTLNDPCHVEMAAAFARRIVREADETVERRIYFAWRHCRQRPPRGLEVVELARLYADQYRWYAEHPDEAEKLATGTLGPIPKGMDLTVLAAWTVVANTLLNLDAVLVKG